MSWLDATEEDIENEWDKMQVHQYPIEEGFVLVATWDEGSTILTWDGNSRVDINLYTVKEEEFERGFVDYNNWDLFSKADFPRGTGSVVNFPQDLENRNDALP
eukprot:CAMPEP_0178846216 /NCGR_PEP_ID=MMETSP0746-20121128/17902_1 /TAXON_ID=913974 /ORGANISM="Nitzschia punctata, Strain CCMP561" /LENGTH=102 /DNA_ID=CAMNT_0020510563 /DNA_START=27 /DNA_END=332 /DNA_ORIENTATION=-